MSATSGRFVAEHWGRAPLYRPGADATGFADLFSLGDVDHILSSTTPCWPAFRLVKDGRQLDPRSYTRSGRVGGQPVDDLADPRRVYELFHGGATIVLQSLHRFWPPLARFGRDLELTLTHPVQVNAYITPPASQGLGVHHDTHDVFVLQVYGRKRWDVHDPDGRATERLLAAELAPGDASHPAAVPARGPHGRDRLGPPDRGGGPHHLGEVARRAVTSAVEGALSGEPLPAGYAADPAALTAGVAEQLAEVRRRLDKLDPAAIAEAAADRFWSSQPPPLAGQLQELLALEEIGDDTVVRRRPGAVCRLRRREDRLEVLLGDRALRMPARLAPVMRVIVASERLAVGDLAGYLDPPSRLVLVRRLVRRGCWNRSLPSDPVVQVGDTGLPSRIRVRSSSMCSGLRWSKRRRPWPRALG